MSKNSFRNKGKIIFEANKDMDPRELSIKDFSYDLPEDRIAKYPLAERDSAKLMIYRNGQISQDLFLHIDRYIPRHSLVLFNNTRVIHARLILLNSKGEKVEIFCLEPEENISDMSVAMSKTGSTRWNCLLGRANKWREKILEFRHSEFILRTEIISRSSDAFIIEFVWSPGQFSFAEILEKTGQVPIPPYLRRHSEEVDETRYQTVYAREEGSVAAPTAGFHFTEKIFESLKANHVLTDEVTLHVSASTFKPVKSDTMAGHVMHGELMLVKKNTIEKLLNSSGHPVIAAGTTALRTIESLYWMGLKAGLNPGSSMEDLETKQWDPYGQFPEISSEKALESLLHWMERNDLERLNCSTRILIAPPYRLKTAQALITNFHQPNSTLLLLVAAVAGADCKRIYAYALQHNFRFLSYGDGSLIFANAGKF